MVPEPPVVPDPVSFVSPTVQQLSTTELKPPAVTDLISSTSSTVQQHSTMEPEPPVVPDPVSFVSPTVQQHSTTELGPPAVPDLISFTSVIESFEEDDDSNIKFTCTKFVLLDKDTHSVWAGSLEIPRTRVKIQQAMKCLHLVPEDQIYPAVSPDMSLTAASDYTPEEDSWLKRPDIALYSQFDDSTVLAEEFLEEIRVHQLIQKNPHPNLVEFRGCLEKNGRVVGVLLKRYAMTLSARVEGSKQTPFDRTSCFEGIQAGVKHLHSLGLAHNDINPENVMLDDQDRPVIIDMASCKQFGEDLYQLGTPGWNDGYEEISSRVNDEIGLQKILKWLLVRRGEMP